MIQPLTDILFVIVGLLSYRSANFVGRLFSDTADRGERDGVIRYGGGLPGNKIWREDSPQRSESRIEGLRFSALFARFLFRGIGVVFAFGAMMELFVSLFR